MSQKSYERSGEGGLIPAPLFSACLLYAKVRIIVTSGLSEQRRFATKEFAGHTIVGRKNKSLL
jgi:hypothetical protein